MTWALILIVVMSGAFSAPVQMVTQTYETEDLCRSAGNAAMSTFASGQGIYARDTRFVCTRRKS